MAKLWQEYSPFLLIGIIAWAVVSGVGALWSWHSGKPLLHAVVTANEWGAALLLAPWFIAGGRSTISRSGRLRSAMARTWQGATYEATRPDMAEAVEPGVWHTPTTIIAARAGLVVFGIDLLIRWGFGLGWKPF